MDLRRFLEAAVGGFVAMLLLAAVALVGWDSGVADLSAGVVVAAGVAVAAIVGLAAHAVDDLADRLCSGPVVSGLIGLPLVCLLALLFVVDLGSGADIVAFSAMVAMILGIVALFGASVTRTRRLREQSTEIVTVSLGETDGENRKQLQMATLVGLVVVGIGMTAAGVALIITGDSSYSSVAAPLGGLAGMLGGLAGMLGNNRGELVVTDTGLVVDQEFLQWDDLTGYRLTDETVEIVTPKWYRSTRTFDREVIGDHEALIEGLAEFLPRVDEQGRVERMARN